MGRDVSAGGNLAKLGLGVTVALRIFCNIVGAGRHDARGHKLAPALLLRGLVVVVAVMRCGKALG